MRIKRDAGYVALLLIKTLMRAQNQRIPIRPAYEHGCVLGVVISLLINKVS